MLKPTANKGTRSLGTTSTSTLQTTVEFVAPANDDGEGSIRTVSRMPELRAEIVARSGGRCEWKSCYEPGVEAAHLHSRGIGGNRVSRDRIDNLAFLCWSHARMSDGEYGDGGAEGYRESHLVLFGARYLEMDAGVIAYERAETLKALIGETT